MIQLTQPPFSEQFPGAAMYVDGRPTPECRQYVNRCIAEGEARWAARDAAPAPDLDNFPWEETPAIPDAAQRSIPDLLREALRHMGMLPRQ